MRLFAPLNQLQSFSTAVPDFRVYGHLIQRCADQGLLHIGRRLHGRLVVLSIIPDNFLASKLISLYSRHGFLPDASKVFDQIPNKNLFAWNAILIAYALHSPNPSRALRLFASSFPSSSLFPDAFTASALLKSLASSPPFSASRLAHEQLHSFCIVRGFDSDLFVANGLVTLYAHVDELGCARKVFDAMPQRDIVSWNSLISGYSQGGQYEACLEMYRKMVELRLDGVEPNGVTVVSVLQACSQTKDLVFGMDVHRFAIENGIQIDITVWNSIVGFYAKCGSLDYARQMFDGMAEKDGVSYSAMITGYMSYGFVKRAMELFQEMPNTGLSTWNAVIAGLFQNNRHSDVIKLVREMIASGLRPNSVTLSSILPSLSFFSNLLGGKQVHGYAIRNECDQNIYVATAIIDTYAKAGFLDGARKVFGLTKGRSVIVWTAIISAFAAHGDANAALSILSNMLDSGTKPDAVTFTAVLNGCAHAGSVEEAHRIFDTMLPIYGIPPGIEHYACMVGVLSRNGMLKEAFELVNKMPFEPNAKVWGALLNGAAVFGDVKLGRFAFDQLVEIEPESTGNYIVMANLYTKAGKWKEAKRVRDRMSGVGLEKLPGCSWIEMSNGLHVFVARDTCNERFEEVYLVLEGLVRLMREEGHVSLCELDEETS
ncbi:pentatricopeptide repeat-containing protein At2g37310 [Typha angustifolia]|uniref:pentatricopeptide repeat-containing protein At2g37310 n=1 Tax=Typha angustifolia TaxID=59011 RepID=UPI003C2C338B